MSCTSVLNSNTINKKCGEIIITIKKNTKNVYSFNCWFCNTIHIQMKKFTLHLEKEHNAQLEQTSAIISESTKSHQNENVCKKDYIVDNNLINEIKIEECENVIKLEGDEKILNETNLNKNKLSTTYQDPLEMYESNLDEIAVNIQLENNTTIVSEENKNENIENCPSDVQMDNLTDDEQNDYQSDYSVENNSSDSDIDINTDDNRLKTFKTNTKAEEKELILALIESYYNYPQLWDTSLTERCNLKEKEKIFQSITDEINEKLNIKLKLYIVKKKLNSICKQYEKEIERQMNTCEENNKIPAETEVWFYDKMSYLKSIVECKLKLKKKKPNNKVKPLSDNELCKLIDIYKNYNSLWDVNHLAYTVKDKRHETMQIMLDEVKKKIDLTLDVYKLEKHLNYLHKSYSKDKQLRLECQAEQREFQPTCSYFDKCDFLEIHQGPFRCTNCNEIIDTYNDFQIHKSQHDGSIPFKCQECGMGFKKITNYTIHAKRHLRVFKFHCEICGKGYPFNAELDLHMRSHTGAQPYLCSVCGEGFRTAISYDNHIRRHEERFKYFCHICKKGFNHMTRLNDHVKAHLNVRDIICTVCGKGFTSRKYLNHHKRIHEGKKYNCNICGKSFAQDAGLRAHKKYHGTPIGVSSIQKEQNKYNL